VLVALALVGALHGSARRLSLVAFAGCAWIGVARLVTTDDAPRWSSVAVALGVAGVVAARVRDRSAGSSS
jgi:hypothetical protein